MKAPPERSFWVRRGVPTIVLAVLIPAGVALAGRASEQKTNPPDRSTGETTTGQKEEDAGNKPGTVYLKWSHLFDPGKPKAQMTPAASTKTRILRAEAYAAEGKLRTREDEPQIGIEGEMDLHLLLVPDPASGKIKVVENVEAEGLTFIDCFRRSTVRMLGKNWRAIKYGVIKSVTDADGSKRFVLDQTAPKPGHPDDGKGSECPPKQR